MAKKIMILDNEASLVTHSIPIEGATIVAPAINPTAIPAE